MTDAGRVSLGNECMHACVSVCISLSVLSCSVPVCPVSVCPGNAPCNAPTSLAGKPSPTSCNTRRPPLAYANRGGPCAATGTSVVISHPRLVGGLAVSAKVNWVFADPDDAAPLRCRRADFGTTLTCKALGDASDRGGRTSASARTKAATAVVESGRAKHM